jgi:hypothetical protein
MSANPSSVITQDMKMMFTLMGQGRVIPIISNSLRIEQIFRGDQELAERIRELPRFYDELKTCDQQLTRLWAEAINYPMSDDYNLARVLQYQQIELGNAEEARTQYIRFLIERLLKNDENNEQRKDTVDSLKSLLENPFLPSPLLSDVAVRLGYPRFAEGDEDPLCLLARLPIKIYITTSHSNFLERALEQEGKTPRTQLCFCSEGKDNIAESHMPARDLKPTKDAPAVVHLFGLEDYPNTLVMSEDDHINFLVDAIEGINSQEVFPSYLRMALANSSLLLLGYQLRDWDFRTLFRFILRVRSKDDAAQSIAIQFKPTLEKKDNEARSLQYLEKYFAHRKFKVTWASSDEFIYDVWNAWKKITQVQQ